MRSDSARPRYRQKAAGNEDSYRRRRNSPEDGYRPSGNRLALPVPRPRVLASGGGLDRRRFAHRLHRSGTGRRIQGAACRPSRRHNSAQRHT